MPESPELAGAGRFRLRLLATALLLILGVGTLTVIPLASQQSHRATLELLTGERIYWSAAQAEIELNRFISFGKSACPE